MLHSFQASKRKSEVSPAFTLVELLVVMAIIVTMMMLVGPAFNSLKNAGDVTKTVYDVAGVLEQARTYAMSNNTYVFVGIAEVDASLSSSGTQSATTATPYGRVAMAVVASKDGTRGYDINNPGDGKTNTPGSWIANYYNGVTPNGANLVAIGKLQHFENTHLAPLASTLPNSGGLTRPVVSNGSYQLGNTTYNPNPSACSTPFDWPLGSALDKGQYSFKRVINFDPQGIARIQYKTNADEITQYMEIGLQQTNGTLVSSGSNVTAIQVDCMTGGIHIYRP